MALLNECAKNRPMLLQRIQKIKITLVLMDNLSDNACYDESCDGYSHNFTSSQEEAFYMLEQMGAITKIRGRSKYKFHFSALEKILSKLEKLANN